MVKIVEFDIAAVILLLFLLFSTIFRGMTKGISNRMIFFVMGTVFASALFDICTVLLENSGVSAPVLLSFLHTGYLITHNLTTPAYVMYIISLTDTWHRFNRNRWQQLLLIVPYLLLIAMLVVNLFTDHMFTIRNNIYIHTEYFWIVYVIAGYYALMGTAYVIIYRRLLSVGKILALIAIIPLVLSSIIIHVLFPQYRVEVFAAALSLLLVSMTVQRPEEILDSHTGLSKYSAYADDIKRSFQIDKRFTVLMLNIDGFGTYQSTISYDDSIKLLKKTACLMNKINNKLHGRSSMYYLDRGRFRMVFSGKNRDKAKDAAYMLSEKLNELLVADGYVSLTPYICITECPEDAKEFNTLNSFGSDFYLKTPDTSSVMFASELFKQDKFDMLNSIDGIINRALKNHNFRMYYQPIYSVEKGRFSSAEALIRLIDDEYGSVPPDLFIPAAEKSGAIHKIGDFVLDDVCRFIASDEFKALGVDYIEINLSVAQCIHTNLPEKVMGVLNKYGITPDKINLEITETAVSRGQDILRANLDKLTGAGISFSLDDYGTGYSNMRRVIQLPLKIVKLDKSFVDEQNNPKMWIVLQNTVKMLKDMNMEIVVEGIETENMAEQFAALNCDFIQGYYYSRPICEEDYVKFVREAHKIV
ncbi:MAG: EAL domain-containing protein [Oscillospiraceae bacterium]|nr:EAL domain-containing protein [Oscillospiraceae bacterium]